MYEKNSTICTLSFIFCIFACLFSYKTIPTKYIDDCKKKALNNPLILDKNKIYR